MKQLILVKVADKKYFKTICKIQILVFFSRKLIILQRVQIDSAS